MKYGEMVRELRLRKEITLRELALNSDIDVAYLSRVERGTIPPPQKEELLEAINEALGATKQEAQQLNDQAAIDNRLFPKDIAENLEKLAGIPLLLRTVANKKLTPDEIREVTQYINKEY